MRKIEDIKEIQSIALGILKCFDGICRSNGIDYMLAYGTLLGAVRHHGFIPWDDDLDVMMTRKEYNKLIEVGKSFAHPYYKFLLPEINKNYYAPLAKFVDTRTQLIQNYGYVENRTDIGIYIDIFVIDELPDDISVAKKFFRRADKLRLLWAMSMRDLFSSSTSFKNRLIRIPISLFCKMFGCRFWRDIYIQFCQRYSNTKHSGIVLYGEGYNKEYLNSDHFVSFSIVTFEKGEYKAPKDVDKYLRQLYGNYLTLPPEEDRKHHPNKIYWK